ncbi:gp12 domain protein [Ochrobactrum quorumnocens]|uniref:Gp12 domain protein n=1 Tax=Ochrobactrum quorumnocens TaxID=271865 RepID=A0A248UIK2_9HYPH|nr:gp12 domain protein [[Ochrobactrum] quorumnocens]
MPFSLAVMTHGHVIFCQQKTKPTGTSWAMLVITLMTDGIC